MDEYDDETKKSIAERLEKEVVALSKNQK